MGYENNVFDSIRMHDYAFCVTDIDEMVPNAKTKAKGLDMAMPLTAQYVGGAVSYVTALVKSGSGATSIQCGKDIGEKYVLNTKGQCKKDGNLVPRHKYINNMGGKSFITGNKEMSDPGYIPAALSSATKINGIGLMKSFVGNTTPECIGVNLRTHTVKISHGVGRYYDVESGFVNIPNDEYEDIHTKNIIGLEKQGFVNIYEPELNLYDEINNYLRDNRELNSHINEYTKFHRDDSLVKIYYILISVIIAYVVFKLLHKKI